MKKSRTPATVQEWQERTGTNTTKLAALVHIPVSHMQKILKRQRRCSYEKALRISMVTGVPVENLIRWMTDDPESQSGTAA